jgi:hypothetical protein
VLWNGTVGITLLNHNPPDGLVVVPLLDMPPSRVVVARNEGEADPLARSFTETAAVYHNPSSTPLRR